MNVFCEFYCEKKRYIVSFLMVLDGIWGFVRGDVIALPVCIYLFRDTAQNISKPFKTRPKVGRRTFNFLKGTALLMGGPGKNNGRFEPKAVSPLGLHADSKILSAGASRRRKAGTLFRCDKAFPRAPAGAKYQKKVLGLVCF